MLFKREVLEGIASGQITLAFRRWRKPTVKAGGRLRTAVGILSIKSIAEIEPAAIGRSDARRAGFVSLDDLLRDLQGQRPGTVYRIGFRLDGPDPRKALRANDRFGAEARLDLAQRLDRLDAGKHGRWTRPVLSLIGRKPGVRAADLAARLGEDDLKRFKTNVRKLKELGLTESLDVGYRLSARGKAFIRPKTKAVR